MIDSSSLPSGGSAQLYLPSIAASEILSWASRLYTTHSLTQADANTIQFPTGGMIYVPVPQGGTILSLNIIGGLDELISTVVFDLLAHEQAMNWPGHIRTHHRHRGH